MSREFKRATGARAAALLLALCLVPSSGAAQRRVEIYEVQHRTAEEMVPLAETAMAGEGDVALDRGTNSLVLIGDPAAISRTLDLLGKQDRRIRTIVLRHGTRRTRELASQGFAVHWRRAVGELRLGRIEWLDRPESSARVQAEAQIRRLAQSLDARIRVTEGERSRIETGWAVPYQTAGPGGPSVEFVQVTSGFEASARVLGDGRVEVDLAPFARELARGDTIETTAASTLVTVRPGEIVVVGALDRSSDARRADSRTNASPDRVDSRTGARAVEAEDETVLLLEAEVE